MSKIVTMTTVKTAQLFVIVLFLFLGDSLLAQPQYVYDPGAGYGLNLTPFNSTSNRRQVLYTPTDFTNPISGFITKVYIKTSGSVSTNLQNFKIYMGTTSATALVAGPFVTTNMTQVFNATAFSTTAISGNWIEVRLQTPFLWDLNANLIVDFQQGGYTPGFGVQLINATGRSLYGQAGAATASAQDRLMVFGFDALPAGPCMSPPVVGKTVSDFTKVCLNATVNLSIDTMTFGQGQSFQWQSSTDSLAWANMPNDTLTTNTTTVASTRWFRCQVVCGSSTVASTPVKITAVGGAFPGGTYTINSSLPTSGTNYTSFQDFFGTLGCGGITGPIVINVTPNSTGYNEQVYIGAIGGTSAINTITINGNNATLKNGGGMNRGTFTLDGAKHIIINKLNIEATAISNNYGVEIRGHAQYITLDSCTVRVNPMATASTTGAFIASTSLTTPTAAGLAVSNLTVTNCLIEGGYYGMVVNGPTTAPWSTNNLIENNEIRDFYTYGMYIRGQQNGIIRNNDINRKNATAYSTFYGMYILNFMEGTQFIGNRIHNTNDNGSLATTNYVMYLVNAIGSAANPAIIANNVIYNINNTGTIYGAYMSGGDHLKFYHNTINLNNSAGAPSTGTVRALYVSGSSGTFDFKNNIVSLDIEGTGPKHLLYLNSTAPTYNFSNNQYSFTSTGGSNTFGYYGASIGDFAAWQAANSGALDQNSVYGNPIFSTTNVFTPQTSTGNAAGENLLSVVPTDIFGVARTSTPDIGAVEYTPLTCLQPIAFSGNSTATTIALSWTNDPGADSVHIEYGPTGFTQGTGIHVNATGDTITIGGLISQTCYDFYVHTWCNGVMGNGTSLFTYCTKCGTKTVPFTEDFNTVPVGSSTIPSMPDCWEYFKTGSTAIYGYTYAAGVPNSLPNHFRMYNGSNTTDTVAIISPAIADLSLGDKRVKFWAKSAAASYNAPVIVGTVPSPEQMHLMTILDTLVADATYAEYIQVFNSAAGYNGIDQYVVFMYGNLGTGQSLLIDDISFELVPVCAAPVGLNATNITSTGATAVWGSVGGTCFKLEYGPTGFMHSTGQGTVIQSATSPQTISGLQPNTYYDYYVFDCCDTNSPAGPYTFKTNCVSQLSGTYTVGGTAGPNNFTRLSDALLALECGVSGPVTFNIAARTDTLTISLEDIQGTSATNTVTFNGAGKAVTTILIPGGFANGVTLDGTAYVTFKNLTIDGSYTDRVVWLTGGAQFITFDDCNLWHSITASLTNTAVVAASGSATSVSTTGNNANNIVIKNSVLRGGYYGVTFYGTSTTVQSTNYSVEGCTFENQYYYAIHAYYIKNLEILNNTALTFRSSTSYGFYGSYIDGFKINANNINSKTYAIYLSQGNANATPTVKSEIINNMLIGASFAVYMPTVNHYNMYHNSMVASTYAAYLSYNTAVDIRNNIFKSDGYPLYAIPAIAGAVVDHNIYFNTGTNVAYWGTSYATLAAWKTAQPTLNSNSLVGDPLFVSATDLHLSGLLANDVGAPGLASIDIDGDVRPAAGSLNVDIGADEYTPFQNDIAVMSIPLPFDQSCGDSNTVIEAVFQNYGSNAPPNFTFTAIVTGAITQTLTATYTGTLSPQGSDTISFPPINTTAGGTYNITVHSNLTGDQDASNDTTSTSVTILDVLQRVPVAYKDTVCAGQYDTLFYPANAGNQSFVWLTTNGDTLGNQDGLVVGPMGTNDTTFVMRAEANVLSVGPLDNTIGSSSFYTTMNHSMLFTVNTTTTILSVDVFSSTGGVIDVIIEDAATFAVLYTHSATVSSGGKHTIILNQSLSPGTYRMSGSPTNNAGGLARTSTGASYPYTAADNSVSITGNTFDSNYYYFFYNWQIGAAGCPRPDGSITIYNGGGVTGTFTTTLQPPTSTDLTVNFDASGVTGASTYTWYYGDGATGTGVTSTHAYTSNGTYTAILEVSSACGVDSITQQVVIAGIGIEESLLGQSLNLFPNPTHGQFRVSFMLEGVQNTSLRILNTLGQVVYEYAIGNISGSYNHDIDMSNQAAGVYILQVITSDGIVNRRITINN